MSKKKNPNTLHISLSKKADRVKAMGVTVFLGASFIASVILAILMYTWAFVISLILPLALYISIKFTIAVYKRGVDLTGDTVEFEPEYRYFVKFNRRELSKIYVKDPITNKECEPADTYKNKEIVFQLKNKDKHGYCLPSFTKEDVENLKSTLI